MKKRLFITLFIVIFLCSVVINLPAWVLSNAMSHYSGGKVRLYNETGSFWHGSGLLVIENKRLKVSAPLVVIDWRLSLGFTKFIDVNFSIDNTKIAEVFLNKNGVNLDKLQLSLSVDQVSQLISIVGNLGLSGDLNLSASHLLISPSKNTGVFIAKIDSISSSMAPVNPLGSYTINLDMSDGSILVSSQSGSVLDLSGSGNMGALSVKAIIDKTKQEQMSQFMTVLGMPNADGSYTLKVF